MYNPKLRNFELYSQADHQVQTTNFELYSQADHQVDYGVEHVLVASWTQRSLTVANV